jgi:hypothetical protein
MSETEAMIEFSEQEESKALAALIAILRKHGLAKTDRSGEGFHYTLGLEPTPDNDIPHHSQQKQAIQALFKALVGLTSQIDVIKIFAALLTYAEAQETVRILKWGSQLRI